MQIFIKLGLATSIALLVTLPAAAQDSSSQLNTPAWVFPTDSSPRPTAIYAWGGFGSTNTFYGGYTGFVAAFNGRLISDGFVARAEAAGGNYSSDSALFPHQRVDTVSGGGLVGYRKGIGTGWLTGYIGGNFEEHDNRDPTEKVRGTQGGVKGLVEYFGPLNDRFDIYASGSYSSAFDTGAAFGRIGYKLVDKVKIGPEASYFSNLSYRDTRVGAFVGYETPFGEVVLSGGYRHPLTNNDPDGYYANIHLGFEIR